ncbi:membrane protein [Mycolicibacterium mucogenicum DSM 44124]|nr:membrane protein [Mycolicibacterium mucogenicum DSM 44124]
MTAMTAINPGLHTRPLSDSSDSLLRFALRVDGTLCSLTGLLMAFTADPLSRLSGLSATSEWIIGAVLVVWGFALYVMAAVPRIRRVGTGVLIGNLIGTVAVLGVLASGVLPLTAAGNVLVLAVMAVGLGCAWLQYLGVRRLA